MILAALWSLAARLFVGVLDPQAAAAKWSQNLAGATQYIQHGVQNVSQAPGAAAAQKVAKYQAGVQQNVQKWARRVGAVTLGEWQQATISKGIPRIAEGAQQAQPKFEAFAAKFFPHLQAGQAKVRSMPDQTIDQRIQRAVEMMRHISQFKL